MTPSERPYKAFVGWLQPDLSQAQKRKLIMGGNQRKKEFFCLVAVVTFISCHVPACC